MQRKNKPKQSCDESNELIELKNEKSRSAVTSVGGTEMRWRELNKRVQKKWIHTATFMRNRECRLFTAYIAIFFMSSAVNA